MKTVCWYKYLV